MGRQLRLTRYLLPQAQRIGVLYGEHSGFLLEELRHAGPPNGPGDHCPGLARPTGQPPVAAPAGCNSDVLLGLEMPNLYNSKTAKNLLLSSYGRRWR